MNVIGKNRLLASRTGKGAEALLRRHLDRKLANVRLVRN